MRIEEDGRAVASEPLLDLRRDISLNSDEEGMLLSSFESWWCSWLVGSMVWSEDFSWLMLLSTSDSTGDGLDMSFSFIASPSSLPVSGGVK